jgi:glycosyltransferase involved in cell wall biosynthesis
MEALRLRVQPEDQLIVSSSERLPDVSVIIPVCEHSGDLREIYREYKNQLVDGGYLSEFILVLDGSEPQALETKQRLEGLESAVRVIVLNRSFGEAAALAIGFEKARAPVVVTIPAYFQVEPGEIREIIRALDCQDLDLVIAERCPRTESVFGRFRSWIFHWLVRVLTGSNFRDLACGVRAMKRRVAEEVTLYGDLHYFFPVLAYQRGFKVAEISVRPSRHDTGRRLFRPGSYLRRALDLLNLFFLVKFTRKPLRFFGSIGAGLFTSGTLIMGYLGGYRLLEGGISHRPLLIFGVLLMVVGIQLFSIGLLGELIIFTHAREVRDFQIKDILD